MAGAGERRRQGTNDTRRNQSHGFLAIDAVQLDDELVAAETREINDVARVGIQMGHRVR